ncbi:uncharacterized protein LOC135147084 [Daucus carota subsp. sativus]|uniref:uncharacterized protein LOC135147071 n=1 Tax=Daucus carota subsp. sativus TaxID=79200 RepID=UPI0030839054
MQLLIQQYESFHFKAGENLSDTFNIFQKLVNSLKLYGRVYQVKDSNLKFLRALPKEWKPMTVYVRNTQEFKDYTLERLYGTLKTYELEMEQDDEIEKNQKKGNSFVALVASGEVSVKDKGKSQVKEIEKLVKEDSSESRKRKAKVKEEADSGEESDGIDEHLAFLSRRFSKLKFKKNFNSAKPFKGNPKSDKSMVDISKFKCFNCANACHFANECRKPKAEKRSNEGVDYKKKYYELLKQKERAFITKDDRAAGEDSDEEDEFVNLALMANSTDQEENTTNSSQVFTTNLVELTKYECNATINEMSTELYQLHVSLKSLTKENNRIKEANTFLSDRNNDILVVLKRDEAIKKQLNKEQEIIARWKFGRDVSANIINIKGRETFVENEWKRDKRVFEISDTSSTDENMDSDHPLKTKSSTDESYPLKNNSLVNKKIVKKLNKKYGPVNKNFVKGESNSSDTNESVNKNHNPNKKLEKKLDGNNKKNLCYLDSGCSRHMTGDSSLLTKFVEKAGPSITFGDDSKGYTMGYGLIAKENVIIDEVALVSGLEHNLLSISQLCDKGFKVSFTPATCVVTKGYDNNVVLVGHRKGNVYVADFNSFKSDSITCLFSKASSDDSWLWHKRLSHLNFKQINELVKKDLVRGIPKLEFSEDGMCGACQQGKQKRSSFKSKVLSSIVKPLQFLHMDLFGS